MAAGFANLGSTSLAKRLGFFLLQHGLQDLLGADGSNRRDPQKKVWQPIQINTSQVNSQVGLS